MSDLRKQIAEALGWTDIKDLGFAGFCGRRGFDPETYRIPAYGSDSREGGAAAWEVLAEIKKRGWWWSHFPDGDVIVASPDQNDHAYGRATGPFPTALGEAFVAAVEATKEIPK